MDEIYEVRDDHLDDALDSGSIGMTTPDLGTSYCTPCGSELRTYPFDGQRWLGYDGGHIHIAVARPRGRPRGLVIFCPGIYGGMGPGRSPNRVSDPDQDAIFPALSRRLLKDKISSCRLSWSHTAPFFADAVKGVLTVALHSIGRIAARAAKGSADPKVPFKLQVCVVGHSFGATVALQVAQGLPGLFQVGSNRSIATLVGVCALAPQKTPSLDGSDFGHIKKLFIHGMADNVIQPGVSRLLYEQACPPKELVEIPDGTHDLYDCKGHVLETVHSFLQHAISLPSKDAGGRVHANTGVMA